MRRTMLGITMGIMVAGIGCSAYGADNVGLLHAGTAKVDITPAPGTGVTLLRAKLADRDHLYARALVLKSDQTSVAIVSMDLILFSSAKVVAEAKAKWKVDHVILCSTHTHVGMVPEGLFIGGGRGDWTRGGDPATIIDWPALSKDPWYAATEEKIIAAIGKASKNIFPATVSGARGPFQSAYMAHNRRLVGADGSVSPMWDNPRRLPTKPIDPTIGVIRVNDAQGKIRAFLVNYACHAVGTMNAGAVSKDYPGAMVDYVEEQLGDQCMAMFTQGAEGDQDPYDIVSGEHGFNLVKQAGISVGKGALNVVESVKLQPAGKPQSLAAKQSTLTLKYRNENKSSDVVLTTIVINNNIALVSIPGEPFIQHQLDLRAKSPLPNTFLLGIAYSGAGTPFTVYIPTAQAVKEGGYGASECSYLEPNAGEKIVDEGVATIKALLNADGKTAGSRKAVNLE